MKFMVPYVVEYWGGVVVEAESAEEANRKLRVFHYNPEFYSKLPLFLGKANECWLKLHKDHNVQECEDQTAPVDIQ